MKQHVLIGIDEIGTGTQLLDGWCYFCLSDYVYVQFEKEAKQILVNSQKLKLFHARKFKKDDTKPYEEFLILIKNYIEGYCPSFLYCILCSTSFKTGFAKLCAEITAHYLKQVIKIDNNDLKEYFQRLTPVLLHLLKYTEDLGGEYVAEIEIDSCNDKKKLKALTHSVFEAPNFDSALIPNFYNYIRSSTFKNSVPLSMFGYRSKSDRHSLAIQAADVIGNFSTSFIFSRLGDLSKSRIIKAEIFEKVFGGFEHIDFASKLRIKGEHDIELIKGEVVELDIGTSLA